MTVEAMLEDRETLLKKIAELDLENIRLKRKCLRLTKLELAVRSAATVNAPARELLKAMDVPEDVK